MRQYLITVSDDYTPADGDAFDAIRDALNHFNVAAEIEDISPGYTLTAVMRATLERNSRRADCFARYGDHDCKHGDCEP